MCIRNEKQPSRTLACTLKIDRVIQPVTCFSNNMSHLQAIILAWKYHCGVWSVIILPRLSPGATLIFTQPPRMMSAIAFPSYLYILYLVLNPCRLLSTKSVYSCERWKGPLSERSQSKGLVACWSETAVTAKTQQWRLSTVHSHRAIREDNSAPALRRHIMLPLGTSSLHPLSSSSTPRQNAQAISHPSGDFPPVEERSWPTSPTLVYYRLSNEMIAERTVKQHKLTSFYRATYFFTLCVQISISIKIQSVCKLQAISYQNHPVDHSLNILSNNNLEQIFIFLLELFLKFHMIKIIMFICCINIEIYIKIIINKANN